jgi:hypothetical protein
MRRSTVLSLLPQLVFPALSYNKSPQKFRFYFLCLSFIDFWANVKKKLFMPIIYEGLE